MNELREGIQNTIILFSKWAQSRHAKTLARKGYRYKGGR